MRPEIEILVDLLARSIYERWKVGEFVPGAPLPPAAQHQKEQLPDPPVVL
ncbi:MAG: hypothetical protein JWO52_7484 [Gammaproteobacteria bacterium]|nr:hypothetical protein [Gammaproteobacteria bacterium]